MNGKVAIIDYGMGNLFSVKQACEYSGLEAIITSNPKEIDAATAMILPGIGAFGDAMGNLGRLNLIDPIKAAIFAGKPFFGICLGMQLLMTESFEFGKYKGLDIVKGCVKRLENPTESSGKSLKVPEVCWNKIIMPENKDWRGTMLNDIPSGEFFYFVHSFYVVPDQDDVILSFTRYGNIFFCSSLHFRNIFACQFHPEKSGKAGLTLYRNFALQIEKTQAGSLITK